MVTPLSREAAQTTAPATSKRGLGREARAAVLRVSICLNALTVIRVN